MRCLSRRLVVDGFFFGCSHLSPQENYQFHTSTMVVRGVKAVAQARVSLNQRIIAFSTISNWWRSAEWCRCIHPTMQTIGL